MKIGKITGMIMMRYIGELEVPSVMSGVIDFMIKCDRQFICKIIWFPSCAS